jgi:hypothetical protein
MKSHCCQKLAQNLNDCESTLVFIKKFREYGICILDGGTSFAQINFCTRCGHRLPPSLRDEWLSQIETLNLTPEDPKIPAELLTSEWWEKRAQR